jgi:transposase-like protein
LPIEPVLTVGIFPNPAAVIRPEEVILAQQHDEWHGGQRCLRLETMRRSAAQRQTGEVKPALLMAS